MTSTVKTIVSDGITDLLSFEFDYLRKEFVKVTANGLPIAFTFQSPYTVRLTAGAPPVDTVIIIRRETERDRLVDFVDGSILLATDLNTAQLQAIHISAEALDAAGSSMVLNEEGAYSAGFRRVSLLGEPQDDFDAVTKVWAETAMTSQLVQAVEAKDSAVLANNAAKGSATTATTKASQASASATNAASSAAAAVASASTADAAASSATTSVATATTKASQAATSATAANTSKNAAATSATSAATSAAEAATSAATLDTSAFVTLSGLQNISGAKTLLAPLLGEFFILASATTVTPNLAQKNRFKIRLTQDVTITNPIGIPSVGQTVMLVLTQDGTGGRLVAWDSYWLFPEATAPTLSTAAGAIDIIIGEVISSTQIVCNAVLNLG